MLINQHVKSFVGCKFGLRCQFDRACVYSTESTPKRVSFSCMATQSWESWLWEENLVKWSGDCTLWRLRSDIGLFTRWSLAEAWWASVQKHPPSCPRCAPGAELWDDFSQHSSHKLSLLRAHRSFVCFCGGTRGICGLNSHVQVWHLGKHLACIFAANCNGSSP